MSLKDNSKSYGRIFLKFWDNVGHGINYKWFNFGRNPAGIVDSGSLWKFRYHYVKGGIRKPLAKRRWWRHLANNIALAEVPAGYDYFLVYKCFDVFVVFWMCKCLCVEFTLVMCNEIFTYSLISLCVGALIPRWTLCRWLMLSSGQNASCSSKNETKEIEVNVSRAQIC